jgi:integrase
MSLTDAKLRNLKPALKPFKRYDAKGLYIEVYPTGSKLWRLRHMKGGKQTRTSLGRYPEISLADARNLAYDFLRREGKAPKGVPERPATLKALAAEWQERHSKNLGKSTIGRNRNLLDRHILPRLGNLDAKTLTARTILDDVARPMEAKGQFCNMHRAVSLLGRILRYGVATGRCERDPTRDIAGALPTYRPKHFNTTVDPAVIRRILLAIDDGKPSVYKDALQILPYVFVRPGELCAAEWKEFNLPEAVWRIPGERMKMRKPHIVPLSRQCVAMFQKIRDKKIPSRHVFPNSVDTDRPIWETLMTHYLRQCGIPKETICSHGFRAMASTILNEKGYRPDWIERQLAHSEGSSVRAAYNHAQWLPDRTKMMQDWADYLDAVKAGEIG